MTTPTEDAVGLLPPADQSAARRYLAWAKLGAKLVGILATAVIAAVTAYRAAMFEAQARVQSSKDLSEAGYQKGVRPVAEDVEQLKRQFTELRAACAPPPDQHRRLRGAPARRPTPPAQPVPPPRTVPANLDEAYRQVYRRGSPAAPDAGRKGE